jgi:putative sterol carrier protein
MVTERKDGEAPPREEPTAEDAPSMPRGHTESTDPPPELVAQSEPLVLPIEQDEITESAPETDKEEESVGEAVREQEREEGAKRGSPRSPRSAQNRDSSRPPRGEGRKNTQNVRQLLLTDVVERALRSNLLLRTHLAGTLAINLLDSPDHFVLDWTGDKPVVRPGKVDAPDCTLHISESNLLRVAAGDLNPQIGMLSEKIRVEGRLSFAVYFFNLVVPPNGH